MLERAQRVAALRQRAAADNDATALPTPHHTRAFRLFRYFLFPAFPAEDEHSQLLCRYRRAEKTGTQTQYSSDEIVLFVLRYTRGSVLFGTIFLLRHRYRVQQESRAVLIFPIPTPQQWRQKSPAQHQRRHHQQHEFAAEEYDGSDEVS